MPHRALLDAFYEYALTGKEITRATLAPPMGEENPFEHIALFEKGFSGYSIRVDDFIDAGEKVVLRARFRGRHTGNFNGLPPTGRIVEFPFIMIYRLEEGRIVQHWLEANHVHLLAQLGMMTAEVQVA
jgi:ketosteroid isomerase-like protein